MPSPRVHRGCASARGGAERGGPIGAVAREVEPGIPADADAITKSLISSKSPNIAWQKDALNRLIRIRPNDRLDEVLAALALYYEHDDEDLVKHVARVLAVWQSPEAMMKLIDMVNDPRVSLRREIIMALGKYDDANVALALVDRFKEDGHLVEEALKSMGPAAEEPLIKLLRSPDSDLRGRACAVLKLWEEAPRSRRWRRCRQTPNSRFASRRRTRSSLSGCASRRLRLNHPSRRSPIHRRRTARG